MLELELGVFGVDGVELEDGAVEVVYALPM